MPNIALTVGASQNIEPDMLGTNGEGFRYKSARDVWMSAGFDTLLASLNTGHLRVFGGTSADYWGWNAGTQTSGTPHPTVAGTFRRAAVMAPATIYQGAPGTLDANNHVITSTPFTLHQWLDRCVAAGLEPLFDLNMVVAKDGTIPNNVADQVAMLNEAVDYMVNTKGKTGWTPKYLELGNEIYLGNADFRAAFGPDAAGARAQYSDAVIAWSAELKSHWPNSIIALTGELDVYGGGTWTAAFVSGPNAVNWDNVDAVTFHRYWPIPGNVKPSSIATAYTFMEAAANQWVGTPGLAANCADTAKVPAGKKVWFDEFNYPLGDSTRGIPDVGNMWCHGLGMGVLMLLMACDPHVGIICPHSTSGGSLADCFYAIAAGKLSTYGRILNALGTAITGATHVRPITAFSSNPTLTGNLKTFYGAIFDDGTSDARIVLMNLNGSTSYTVDLPPTFSTSTLTKHGYSGTYNDTGDTLDPITGTVTNGTVTLPPFSVTVLTGVESSGGTLHGCTFTVSGLPAGTTWGITTGGGHDHTAVAPNSVVLSGWVPGVYNFTTIVVAGYTAAPASGQFDISAGDATVPITYTAIPAGVTLAVANAAHAQSATSPTPAEITHAAVFNRTGAPGESWSAKLGWPAPGNPNNPKSATGDTITFSGWAPGAYPFEITPPAGYTAIPASGTADISTGDQTVDIVFADTAATATVTFDAHGLPPGALWGVALDGNPPQTTRGDSISFAGVAFGAHTYTVTLPPGYDVDHPTGSFTLA